MAGIKLGMVEAHFADIVWEHAPLSTKELVALCEKELNWKRTTTYTVLKKLCDRGLFETRDSTVAVRITKDEFHTLQSEQFVQENFHGSLPAFIAAFTANHTLTQEELEQIRKMMDAFVEG